MRRNLLTDAERHLLFGIPSDRPSLIQHYTLLPEEVELLQGKRGARNRLGFALQLRLFSFVCSGIQGLDWLAIRRFRRNCCGIWLSNLVFLPPSLPITAGGRRHAPIMPANWRNGSDSVPPRARMAR